MKQLKVQVKIKCEVEHTPISVASRRAGRPELDSRQEQDVSLLHIVQTASGAHPASCPMSTGGSFSGGKTVGA
jgi:hypothetical protein